MKSPMTVGSRSTKRDLGTCFPAMVSEKKVLNASSSMPMDSSEAISPLARMPCSRQYSSQHALPICTPACPRWTDTISRMVDLCSPFP